MDLLDWPTGRNADDMGSGPTPVKIVESIAQKVIDPDTYVNWLRTEDPGQNPRWESKCGCIIQVWKDGKEEYWGFPWPDAVTKTRPPLVKGVYYTTFSSAKSRVEKKYFALHPEENVAAY